MTRTKPNLAVRNGLPLDASSMEFVQPGDYAAYSGSYDNQLHGVGEPWPSFHERESMLGLSAYDPDTPLHNDMSNDIIAAVNSDEHG